MRRSVRSGVRRGVTLIELIVVILLLGLLAGVVGLTMGSTPTVASLDAATVAVMQARDSALKTGHRVTIALSMAGRTNHATAYPDGRVLIDAPIAIDPLSGSTLTEDATMQRGATHAER